MSKTAKRILIWTGSIIAGLIALIILGISIVVWTLTPSRLTPMVEKYASDYLTADLRAARVELSFWHTFPNLTLDVDSLAITSRSLDALPDSLRSGLPADASQLMSFRRFHGAVNILPLFVGTVKISDIELDGLRANLLQINDRYSNFDIVPPSTDDSPISLPNIVLNRFSLTDCGPLAYTSLADSISGSVSLKELNISGSDAPAYQLVLDGAADSPLLRDYNFSRLALGLDGRLAWESSRPMRIALDDFTIAAGGDNVPQGAPIADYPIRTRFNLTADLTDPLTVVERFAMELEPVSVAALMPHVPAEYSGMLSPLHTDMAIGLKAELSEPYTVGGPQDIPSAIASLAIAPCSISYDGLEFSRFVAVVEAVVNGKNPDLSTLNIKELTLQGRLIDMGLKAEATHLLTDPAVKGIFTGNVDFAFLPAAVKPLLPFTIKGDLSGKSDFSFRMSDFTPATFHRIKARGELTLSKFAMTMDDNSMEARLREANLHFGTSERYHSADVHADSLLTLSLKVDTMQMRMDSTILALKNLRAGLGVANLSTSIDSTQVNPFGGTIALDRFSLESEADTLRLRLRQVDCRASLRRYKNNAKSPIVNFAFNGKRVSFGQGKTRISLSDSHVDLTLHQSDAQAARKKRTARRRLSEGRSPINRADSILIASGHLRGSLRDSVDASAESEYIDFGIDSLQRRMLRIWDINGHLTARRGRIATPFFPLRNRLSNIDLSFTLDSIQLKNLRYKAGQSDFTINGSITNLRRALTSRRHSPIGLDLSVVSDTLNVNELIQAAIAGGALAESTSSDNVWSSDDVDDKDLATTDDVGPLLVPLNVDGRFEMKAKNVVYSDFLLNNFVGEMLVYNGAVNLRNLSASTDIGSVDLSALYSAPTPDDMEFGMGLKINNFQIGKLIDFVPAIDSLMPALKDFSGIVNADVAATTRLTPQMDFDIPSLKAAVKVNGDSLVLLDTKTFKKIAKWLFFKDKNRNMIDHLSVEAIIDDSQIELFPFLINMDRYSFGVMGSNDLAMNLNYHISVLKSPIPFKFGINIKGNADKMKIRFGGAKYKDKMVVERKSIADTTRINLIREIDKMFRRSVSTARVAPVSVAQNRGPALDSLDEDALSGSDSLLMMQEGMIDSVPPLPVVRDQNP